MQFAQICLSGDKFAQEQLAATHRDSRRCLLPPLPPAAAPTTCYCPVPPATARLPQPLIRLIATRPADGARATVSLAVQPYPYKTSKQPQGYQSSSDSCILPSAACRRAGGRPRFGLVQICLSRDKFAQSQHAAPHRAQLPPLAASCLKCGKLLQAAGACYKCSKPPRFAVAQIHPKELGFAHKPFAAPHRHRHCRCYLPPPAM